MIQIKIPFQEGISKLEKSLVITSQILSKTELTLGAETTPPIDNPKAGADVTSEVSAPPFSTSPYVEEREQEVVTAPKMDHPVPNKVIASCSYLPGDKLC